MPLSETLLRPASAVVQTVAVPAVTPVRRAFSVYRVVQRADEVLREKAPEPIWVRGEVSSWSRSRNGHCYFTLKDDRAQLSCVLFGREARALPALPENGMEVEVLGRLGIYTEGGRFQLTVERIESTGMGGMWQVAVDRLLRDLRAEGLLDEARKRPLPACPDRIGIVTSPAGAALHDMHRALRRKAWWVRVLLSPCAVEGAQSAPEVAAAIRRFGHGPGQCAVDVVLVARGGGSKESLWAFNHEEVARAIAECPFPVISAVGHETDHTVADQVADVRAATPTAGAERAVPEGADILAWLRGFPADARLPLARRMAADTLALERTEEEMRRALGRRLGMLRTHLAGAERHLDARSPRQALRRAAETAARARPELDAAITARLADLGAQVDALRGELDRAVAARVATARRELAGAVEALDARSPTRVLARGYALVTDSATERVVRAPADVRPGQPLRVRLAAGEIAVRVEPSPPALPNETPA